MHELQIALSWILPVGYLEIIPQKTHGENMDNTLHPKPPAHSKKIPSTSQMQRNKAGKDSQLSTQAKTSTSATVEEHT